VSRDSTDDKFIALAIDANAKIIISGDLDLKEVKTYKGVRILSPAKFLEFMRAAKNDST
jgi:predicted nucleic acid-binding protein